MNLRIMKINSFKIGFIIPLCCICINLFSTSALGQSSDQISQLEKNTIISKCLTHELLFDETNVIVDNISSFYILDHGVELDFSSDLKINTKPVVLIQKSAINTLNGAPYFLFHTLHIEGSKAFARIYLTYTQYGEIKTNNVDVSFVKLGGQWQISTDQL